MKHVPHSPQQNFSKKSKFWVFSKKGGYRSQKIKILNFFFRFEIGFKKHIWNMCHIPPTKFFKKLIFLVFSKKGVKGVKKWKKKKNAFETCATLPKWYKKNFFQKWLRTPTKTPRHWLIHNSKIRYTSWVTTICCFSLSFLEHIYSHWSHE